MKKANILASLTIAAGIATLCNPVQAVDIGGINITGTFTVVNPNSNNPTYTLGSPTGVNSGDFQFANTTFNEVSFQPNATLDIALTGGTGPGASTTFNFPAITGDFLTVGCSGAFDNCSDPGFQFVTARNLQASAGGASRSPGQPSIAYNLFSTILDVEYVEPSGLVVPGTISFFLTKPTATVQTYSITLRKAQNPNISVPEPSAALGMFALASLGLGSSARNRRK